LTIAIGLPNPLPNALEGATSVYQGTIDEGAAGAPYPLELASGDAVLLQTQALSGDLDTIITLLDPNGTELRSNDDANLGAGNLNSALFFQAENAGTYTVVVSNYGGPRYLCVQRAN
jgi:hypothetical protein